MFQSPTRTSPLTPAPGMVSCMRLRQRMKVDFPHPDGPMIAVARPATISMEISCRTSDLPNHARRLRTLMPTLIGLCRPFQNAATGDNAYDADGRDDERDQHQCAGPRLPVPFFEW